MIPRPMDKEDPELGATARETGDLHEQQLCKYPHSMDMEDPELGATAK